ncbi:MAG: cytochrome c biogenesis protein CcsA [Candidatus Pacebacteria bacterium]|nr:cytochrome c biogenesis protein CcsA [Candidatus Paceibacterota bacterium]
MIRLLSLLFFGLSLTSVLAASKDPASLAENDSAYDTLVLQHRGRIKPFLSFAQELTASLTGRTSISLPDHGKVGARQLILSLWQKPAGWENEPIILVEDPALRKILNLAHATRHFSPRTLVTQPQLAELTRQAETARAAGPQAEIPHLATAAQTVSLRLRLFSSLVSGDAFRVIPPTTPSLENAPWSSPQLPIPLSELLEKQNGSAFSRAKIQIEVAYLKFHPFRLSWIAWLLSAFVLLVVGRNKNPRLLSVGTLLAWIGLFLLVVGFAIRIWIAGRPPVTNMYESILWVAFGAGLFAVIFTARHHSTIYLLAASPVIILSLIASDLQPAVLDPSLNPLVPVLRSNFWLTTHVLTITLSYGAFALATALAHFLVIRSIRINKLPSADDSWVLHLYRCLQIGVLLLAVGVILGGVWANYSWGRFWDWDPKETWALIALMAYIILLHGRLGGWWGGYGLAVGSIASFLTILMAWYGVNFVLGRGLHSYGFGNGGQLYVGAFALLELIVLAFALLRRPKSS